VATSKLQIAVGELLDSTFPWLSIRENHRPDWLLSSSLTRLELDYYIEELKIAFEIQGRQHNEYVEFFHRDYSGYEKRKKYDEEKKDLCYGAGIKLVEIYTLMDAIIEIKSIEENIPQNKIKSRRPRKGPKGPSRKYLNDQKRGFIKGDPDATLEERIIEIGQCKKKFDKFLRRKKNNIHNIPYFKFKFLGYVEQCALLEEYGIQSKVMDEGQLWYNIQ